MTVMVEGDPGEVCRRTVYGSIDGLVYFRLELTTLMQPNVARFLRQVADEFAKADGGIITGA